MSDQSIFLPDSLRQRLERIESERGGWTCPEHSNNYGSDRFECGFCEEEQRRAERNFTTLHYRYRWWSTKSGVPLRQRCVTPETLSTATPSARTLRKAVSGYLSDLHGRMAAGEGLVLLGAPGLGKTLALTAIVNMACQSGARAVYCVWPEALSTVKAGFNGDRHDERREVIADLYDVDLLALDELGIKAASEFDHAELFNLVDYRYSNRKPTLAATNCTASEFSRTVGERIADRLQETGPILALQGDSLRGKTTLSGPDAFSQPPAEMTVRVHRSGTWTERTIHKPESL